MIWDGLWKSLEVPAPVWLILLVWLLGQHNSSSETDEKISDIHETVEQFRRRYIPSESERQEDPFAPPK